MDMIYLGGQDTEWLILRIISVRLLVFYDAKAQKTRVNSFWFVEDQS